MKLRILRSFTSFINTSRCAIARADVGAQTTEIGSEKANLHCPSSHVSTSSIPLPNHILLARRWLLQLSDVLAPNYAVQ